MTTPTPDSPSSPPTPEHEGEGKTAKELQKEAPPAGTDDLPPTNPAGEPHLA